jgi:glycosyltransferase involved in cell wall biosynthesis
MGGIPYAVAAGGWIVPPTVDDLAAGLTRAHAEAESRSAAARARYLAAFTPSTVLSALIDVYESLSRMRAKG